MNSTCIIFTDSKNCIDTFNYRMNHPNISPRKRLKQNHFLIWNLIFWLIEHHNLTVNLNKVKAHSGDKFNDMADRLAAEGCFITDPIIVNFKFFKQSSLGFINWNNIYIVDRNLRTFANTPIRATLFNSLVNNSSLTPIHQFILNGKVDWHFTQLWIKYNPFDTPTSDKLVQITWF
jgi:hypothetical protein